MLEIKIFHLQLLIQEHKMGLWEDIVKIYPELTDNDFDPKSDKIILRDDSDGSGAYIQQWNHELSLPKGMKIGK